MNYKNISRAILVLFFFGAGLNHFVNQEFYLPLIPDYLPFPIFINSLTGVLEMLLAILLIPLKTRNLAVWTLILMLIAFIPSHIYFIELGSCIKNGLCVPSWLAWLRLIIIHPLLIYWIWSQKR